MTNWASISHFTWLCKFAVPLALLCYTTTTTAASEKNTIKSLPGYPEDLPFKMETGYIGVGESDEIQMFYYFVESQGDPKIDPLLLWTSGGPGCSSFTAFVYEIGPLTFNYSDDLSSDLPQLHLNPYSWTKVASIIFLDAPVGTGFTYATNAAAWNTSDTLAAAHTYEFLRKWLIDHPNFITNPLYICGDSYAGKTTPIYVQTIINGNEMGLQPKMTIRGYLIGNGVTYEEKDLNSRIPYAHRVSILSDELYEAAKVSCKGDYVNVDANNTECKTVLLAINDCIDPLYGANILEPNCEVGPSSPKKNGWIQSSYYPEDFLPLTPNRSRNWCREYNYFLSYLWNNDEKVREALHVRKGTIKEWVRCNWTIQHGISYTKDVNSVVGYHRNFTTKFLRALIYSGDQDLLIPYLGTLAWIRSLSLSPSQAWRPWFVQGQVAGFTLMYRSTPYTLTFATVKGGGHMAAEYKPEECFHMVDRWFSFYDL